MKNHGKCPTAVAEAAAKAPWKVTCINEKRNNNFEDFELENNANGYKYATKNVDTLRTIIPCVLIFVPRSGSACFPSTYNVKLCLHSFAGIRRHWKFYLESCNIHSFLTCKVVFRVSIGVIKIRHSPADIEAAPVFAAIGKS